MQRYFADITNNRVLLSKEDEHHITHVMRMRVGEQFEVVSSSRLYVCEIVNLSPLEVKIVEEKEEDVELSIPVTLFFALAKGDKIDLVIQKATELGIHRIVLFKSRRCIVNFEEKDIAKKLARYQKIAKEASEQCHRLIVPEILGVVDLKGIKPYLQDINYLAYEKEAGSTTESFTGLETAKSVSVMIGSEGGFDEDEVDYLVKEGFSLVSLGKRILRCETAAIYALSVLSYKLEK